MTRSITTAIFTFLASICIAFPAVAQDAEAGEKVFKKCKSCHKIGEGATNGPGPVLNNVIGRAAGTYEDFKYGKGMLAASEKGLVWTEELIEAYITDPKKYLRAFTGNKKAKAKMVFKLKNPQQRLDVIAYLKTFSATEEMQEEKMTRTSVMVPTDIPQNAVCVQNASDHTHFFAAEAAEGSRVTKELASGESLCTAAMEAPMKGTVSVFEHADEFEGCTRIVQSGMVEQMRKYAEFDRCLWSSNDG
ncbi:MAG: cytochrome c family protein [Rhodobacteraceae bacterium]|nr:cytochrome c family protein [Paracoccaceae bacterium]